MSEVDATPPPAPVGGTDVGTPFGVEPAPPPAVVEPAAARATDEPAPPPAGVESASGVPADVDAPPPAAEALFGGDLARVQAYAVLLCGEGVRRGLLGPREAERIWDRHLLNGAALAPLIADGARLLDLGSGAGLPGLALALARPDLEVTLLDSLARRVTFLQEAVEALALGDRVSVVRGRAEELRRDEDVVTARAVGDLATVGRCSRGLLRPGGQLLAVRGESAPDELAAARETLTRSGWQDPRLVVLEPAGVTAVRVVTARRR